MKIEGNTIPLEDVIVYKFLLTKAKLNHLGISGAYAIRKTFLKYYDKSIVDKIMLYNRHNRKISEDILKKYEHVYQSESKQQK